jgi:site-specific recombinase XerC
MIKHQVEESTYTGYKRQIEGRLKKYFTEHSILLEDLKPVHILDFYNSLYSEGLKGNTVVKYHANIRKALDYAVQRDLILSNPAIKVGRPQQEQFIADYYNEEELNNLFKVVRDTPIELIVNLTAFYGLRRSEVLGLKWSAIDLKNKTITISHKVITVTDESENARNKTKIY